jgi:transglycosylase-like protein with SLT domain
MPSTTLIVLARRIAGAHALDPALVCAVIEQESSWNPYAMRYEPTFFSRYVAPLYTNNKITASEAWARGFSWGLMQVMGQVAREHGFAAGEHPFLSELCDPEQGITVGCRILSAKLALASNDFPRNATRPVAQPSGCASPSHSPISSTCSASSLDPALLTRALLLWNGGGNPNYPAQVLARLPRYA